MSSPDIEALANTLEPLLDLLSDRIAAKIAERLARPAQAHHTPARRLLTLDELVELLPAGKEPATWRRWLYQRTRLGQVPGCHKIGARLFFDADITVSWLETGCTPPALAAGGEQSLHVLAMNSERGPG